MADSVQDKVDHAKSSVFYFSLIKVLVVEEIGNLNMD
jgi:hypothetical protein